MNASEKAKALKANGYHYFSTGSSPVEPMKTRTYTWLSKKGAFVPNGSSRSLATATNVAYQHYLDAQKEAQSNQPLAELEALRQQVAKLEGDLQAAQEKHAKDSRINLNLSEENATLRRGIETEIVYHRHSIEVNGRYNDAFYLGRVDAANHAKTRLEMLLVKPLPTEALEATEAVTLSESEIELLAKMYNGECFIGLGDLLGEVGKRLLVFSKKRGIFTEYHLDAEYRIPKNAFAIQARYEQLIEARRLQLAEKA